jgi:hypothetical protein
MSERHPVFLADDVREGRALLPGAALRAIYPLDGDGVEEAGAETESHSQAASGSYQAFAQLVGLPDGPVRTTEGHMRREREKRARENKEKREQKAANQRVTRFVQDQNQQRNGSAHGGERESGDLAEESAQAAEVLPQATATGDVIGNGGVSGTNASRKRKVSMDASLAGSDASNTTLDPSGDGKNRPKGRKRTA